MTEKKGDSLNLTIIALVALVAIVGVAAIALKGTGAADESDYVYSPDGNPGGQVYRVSKMPYMQDWSSRSDSADSCEKDEDCAGYTSCCKSDKTCGKVSPEGYCV